MNEPDPAIDQPIRRASGMPSARIRLGTSGWAYPAWIGPFYPPGSKQEHILPFYARVFDTVELDTTFYGPPKPTIARSWARHTPDDFRFAAKLPRTITHDAALVGARTLMDDFVRSLEPLGEKLGPLLVQLPAEFERHESSVADLARFLEDAPKGTRLAVELRHRSWHVDATWDLLRERRAAAAWIDWRDLPRATPVTSDFLFVRWLGDRRTIVTYDTVQLDRGADFDGWEGEIRRALPEVREVYGYFNNHWAGHSPASANEMKRRLGLLVVDPHHASGQAELF